MNARICIGCGEPFPEAVSPESRHANLCPSCSSLVDGMGDESAPTLEKARARGLPAAESAPGQALRKAA